MTVNNERKGIKVSIFGGILLAGSAVIMALIAKSQAILLDGLYTFITLAMAFLSLKVIDVLEVPENKNRPFGFMALEPFTNLVKSMVVSVLLIFFLVSNIQELCSGGRIISLGLTTVYIFACLIIYAVIIALLKRYQKGANSAILDLEIKNWCIDALITVGIAVSLVIAMVLVRMGYTKILPYVDPVIVILLILVSFPVPLKALVVALKRLLLVSSENDVEREAKKQLVGVIEKHGMVNVKIWGLKSGRTHYLFVYSSLKDENKSIDELDEIRADVFRALSEIYSRFWADIMFTKVNPEKPFPGIEQSV